MSRWIRNEFYSHRDVIVLLEAAAAVLVDLQYREVGFTTKENLAEAVRPFKRASQPEGSEDG